MINFNAKIVFSSKSLLIYLCLGLRENPRVGLKRHNKEHKREQSDKQRRHTYTQLLRSSRLLEDEQYDDLFSSRVELKDSEVYRGARETARAQGAPDILKQVIEYNPSPPPSSTKKFFFHIKCMKLGFFTVKKILPIFFFCFFFL